MNCSKLKNYGLKKLKSLVFKVLSFQALSRFPDFIKITPTKWEFKNSRISSGLSNGARNMLNWFIFMTQLISIPRTLFSFNGFFSPKLAIWSFQMLCDSTDIKLRSESEVNLVHAMKVETFQENDIYFQISYYVTSMKLIILFCSRRALLVRKNRRESSKA